MNKTGILTKKYLKKKEMMFRDVFSLQLRMRTNKQLLKTMYYSRNDSCNEWKCSRRNKTNNNNEVKINDTEKSKIRL